MNFLANRWLGRTIGLLWLVCKESQPMQKHIRRQVRLVAVSWGLSSFTFSIVFPFLSIYLHEQRGFSMSVAGLVFPVIGLANIVSPLVSGMVVDRFGYRCVLIGGPLLRCVGQLMLALMVWIESGFFLIALGIFIVCFAGKFFQNAADAFMIATVPRDQRSEAFSTIRVGLNVGWMIGPALGAFLARTPFSLLFCVAGAACILISVFASKLDTEVLEMDKEYDEIRQKVSFFKLLFRDRKMLTFSLCAFLLFLVTTQLITTFSVYATGVIGISKNALGYLYTINGVLVILLQIPANRFLGSRHLGLKLMAGALLYTAGYFSIAFGQVWFHLMISVMIFTFGEIIIEPALASTLGNLAPSGMLGRYAGVLGMFRGVGFSIGPYFGSLLYDSYKREPVILWGCICLSALVAAVGFFINRKKEYLL